MKHDDPYDESKLWRLNKTCSIWRLRSLKIGCVNKVRPILRPIGWAVYLTRLRKPLSRRVGRFNFVQWNLFAEAGLCISEFHMRFRTEKEFAHFGFCSFCAIQRSFCMKNDPYLTRPCALSLFRGSHFTGFAVDDVTIAVRTNLRFNDLIGRYKYIV